MDLRRLSYFLSVAETGGFNAAARQRHVAQSALSRQIALLEDEIGAPLFERHKHGVVLTYAGQLLKGRVERLMRDAVALRREIQSELAAPIGEVSLGLTHSIRRLAARSLLLTYRNRYPQVQLRVVEGTSRVMVDAVLTGSADLAVFASTPGIDALEIRPLAQEPVVLVGPLDCELQASATVDIARLSELPMIMTTRPDGLRRLLDERLRRAGCTVQPAIEVDTLPLCIELIGAGIGYTAVPFSAVQVEVSSGLLKAVPIQDLEIVWVLGSVLGRPLTTAARLMHEAIVAEFDRMLTSGQWSHARRVGEISPQAETSVSSTPRSPTVAIKD